jgi:hypothetical protein
MSSSFGDPSQTNTFAGSVRAHHSGRIGLGAFWSGRSGRVQTEAPSWPRNDTPHRANQHPYRPASSARVSSVNSADCPPGGRIR